MGLRQQRLAIALASAFITACGGGGGGSSSSAANSQPVAVTNAVPTSTSASLASMDDDIFDNSPPIASNVNILDGNNGSVAKNDLLKGSYTYYDLESDLENSSQYLWSRDTGELLASGDLNYRVSAGDRGSKISFEVVPKSDTGSQNYKKYTAQIEVPFIEANKRWRKVIVSSNPEVEAIVGFDGPYGLTVKNNIIFVSDLFDHKVISFSSNYKFDRWVGYNGEDRISWEEGAGFQGQNSFEIPPMEMLDGPHSMDISSLNNLYVADFFGKKVYVLNANGSFSHFLSAGSSDELDFKGPANVYIDDNDNIYVSDYSGNRIFIFDKDETFKGWLGESAVIADKIKKSGEAIKSTDLGGFDQPHMVAVDNSGNIYVVEERNNRIQKFSASFDPLGWVGFNDASQGRVGWRLNHPPEASDSVFGFDQPVSITVVDDYYLVIADHANHRVVRYGLDGSFAGWIGGSNDNPILDWTSESTTAEISYNNAFFRALYDVKIFRNKLLVADGHKRQVVLLDCC